MLEGQQQHHVGEDPNSQTFLDLLVGGPEAARVTGNLDNAGGGNGGNGGKGQGNGKHHNGDIDYNQLFLDEVKKAIGMEPPPRTITITANEEEEGEADSALDLSGFDASSDENADGEEVHVVTPSSETRITPIRNVFEEEGDEHGHEATGLPKDHSSNATINRELQKQPQYTYESPRGKDQPSIDGSSSLLSGRYDDALEDLIKYKNTVDEDLQDESDVSTSFARFLAMDKAAMEGVTATIGGTTTQATKPNNHKSSLQSSLSSFTDRDQVDGILRNSQGMSKPSPEGESQANGGDDAESVISSIARYEDVENASRGVEAPPDTAELYRVIRTLYKHLRHKDDELEKERETRQARDRCLVKMAKEMVSAKDVIKKQSQRIDQLLEALQEEQEEKDELENRLENNLFVFNEEQEDFCKSLEEELEFYKSIATSTAAPDTHSIFRTSSSFGPGGGTTAAASSVHSRASDFGSALTGGGTEGGGSMTTYNSNILSPDYLNQLNDRDAVFAVCSRYGGDALQHVKDQYQDNERIVLSACKVNGLAIQFGSPRIRKMRKIVLVACQQSSGLALFYALGGLKSDKEFVLAICSDINGWALSACSPKLQADFDVVIAACRQNGLALQFASKKLKRNKQVVLAACLQNGEALQYAATSGISRTGNYNKVGGAALMSFVFRKSTLNNDKRFVMTICARNGKALAYASPKLQADKEVVKTAIKSYPDAIKYAKGNLNKDPECVRLAADQRDKLEEKHLHEASMYTKTDGEENSVEQEADGNESVAGGENAKSEPKRKIILSTECSTKATQFVVRFEKHAFIQNGKFDIHSPNTLFDTFATKNTCDYDDPIDFDEEESPCCRGTTASCRKEDIALRTGAPQDGSCWRYTFRYQLEQAKNSNGFMIQVIERQQGSDEQQEQLDEVQEFEADLAKEVGIKVFRIHTMVERPFDNKDIDSFVTRIREWYDKGCCDDDMSDCVVAPNDGYLSATDLWSNAAALDISMSKSDDEDSREHLC